jgi:glycerol transport system ATP-binding protein
VAMGRAIVRDPKVFLMDEPLSNLDAKLRVQMRTEISRIQQQLGTTMIYVTHDQTEALTFADRVVVMNDGRAVQIGTPEELFERPEHTFVGYFIGSPGMNLLPARISGNRAYIGSNEISLDAAYPTLTETTNLQIGIRPDFVTLSSTGGAEVQVRRVDDFGRKRLAHVTLGGLPLVATVPLDMPSVGTAACVNFDASHVLVYQNDIRVEGVTA